MANKNIKELRNFGKDELKAKVRDAEEALFKDRIKLRTGQLENVSSLWSQRKQLARMKGLLTELERK